MLGLSITVYLAFKNAAFRDWCFRELGEERVRRVVGNPVIGRVAAMATTIGGAATVVTALAYSHIDATMRDIRVHAFKIEFIQIATDQHEARINTLRTQRTEDLANRPELTREIQAEYSK